MKISNEMRKIINELTEEEIMLYTIEAIVEDMLLHISKGNDLATEVMFAANCLEILLDLEFTEDEEIRVYMELIKIIKKHLYEM